MPYPSIRIQKRMLFYNTSIHFKIPVKQNIRQDNKRATQARPFTFVPDRVHHWADSLNYRRPIESPWNNHEGHWGNVFLCVFPATLCAKETYRSDYIACRPHSKKNSIEIQSITDKYRRQILMYFYAMEVLQSLVLLKQSFVFLSRLKHITNIWANI